MGSWYDWYHALAQCTDWYHVKQSMPPDRSTTDAPVRGRILEAAFAVFTERGFADTTTLEIATRAHVSKRSLYAEVGTKLDILVACITDRAQRLRMPAESPNPRDRASLERALTSFGTRLVREVADPVVVSVFRLGIAEAVRTPEIAQALQSIAREPIQVALRRLMERRNRRANRRDQPYGRAFTRPLWGSTSWSTCSWAWPLSPTADRSRAARRPPWPVQLYPR